MVVEFKRVANGYFEVYKDGDKTKYYIFNGSLGLSGNGSNVYFIMDTETGKATNFQTLAKCKKNVTFWLSKQ